MNTSTEQFQWTDELVKEYGDWVKQKSDVFSSNPLFLVEEFIRVKSKVKKEEPVFNKEKEFQKVLKCLKNNNVMVDTREDGIYIRLAGNESKGEAFTLHFALAYPFPKTFTAPESLSDHPMCKKEEPKQWEILSFRGALSKNIVWNKLPNGKYKYGDSPLSDSEYTLKYMLESLSDGDIKIESVKRIDGEVFTVGDRLDGMGKIELIEANDSYDGGMVFSNDNKRQMYCLSTAKKEKSKPEEPLPIKVEVLHLQYNGKKIEEMNNHYEYRFCLNVDQIPTEKYEPIKKAIESVLNGDNIFDGKRHSFYLQDEAGLVEQPLRFSKPIKVESINFYTSFSPKQIRDVFSVRLTGDISEDKLHDIKQSIEDTLQNKYKPWKMYQQGFTKDELLEAQKKAFEEGRLTHPMIGFKHDNFESYIKSLNKQ